MCGVVEILGSRRGSARGLGVGSSPTDGRPGRTPDRRSSSAERSGRPFRQSQQVVDVHRAVNASVFRAFPQTVARILWTGRLDKAGEHMFSYRQSQWVGRAV
jgi:hypothetical protein